MPPSFASESSTVTVSQTSAAVHDGSEIVIAVRAFFQHFKSQVNLCGCVEDYSLFRHAISLSLIKFNHRKCFREKYFQLFNRFFPAFGKNGMIRQKTESFRTARTDVFSMHD